MTTSAPPAARDPSTSPDRVAWLLALTLALGTLAFVVAVAAAHATTSAFEPLNGSFQAFQPVRRLLAGEWPGRDFVVYLGLGPTYVVGAVTGLLGGTFHDARLATYALAGGAHALTIAALVRWSGGAWRTAWAFAAVGTVLVLTPGAWLPTEAASALDDAVVSIVTPGNSLLGVRAAAPLVALGLVGAWRAWRARRAVTIPAPSTDPDAGTPRADAWVVGAAAGIVAPWSNDYGFVTAAVLVALESWFAPAPHARGAAAWRTRADFVLRAGATALVVGGLVVFAATGGGVRAWYADGVAGVARDQRWFFFHGPRGSAWQPLGWFPYALAAVACTLALVVASRTRRPGDRAIAVLVLACSAAAVLAARASAETRYFHPLFRVVWILAPLLAWRGVLAWRARAARSRGPSSHASSNESVPRDVSTRHEESTSRATGRLEVARGFVVAAGLVALATGLRAARHERLERTPESAAVVACPEAGAPLPAALGKIAWLARQVGAECDAARLAPGARVFSTYSTMFDLVAGARQPAGADYVIHALGPAARARYVETLRRVAPPYATTIRDDRSGFEGWVRKVAWPFYAELIEHYDPFERLPHAVVWRRRASPRPPSDVPVSVTWTAQDERGRARIEVAVDTAHAARGTQIVEVEVLSTGGILPDAAAPPFGTNFVVGIDLQTQSVGGRFGVDPTATRVVFPLEVVPGTPTVARLVPLEGGRLAIDAVRARTVIAKSEIDAFALARFAPAERTDTLFSRGIRREEPAGFVVVDPSDLAGLAPGVRLAFASGTERTVIAVEGDQVHVDGGPLDPATDGHPALVRVASR